MHVTLATLALGRGNARKIGQRKFGSMKFHGIAARQQRRHRLAVDFLGQYVGLVIHFGHKPVEPFVVGGEGLAE